MRIDVAFKNLEKSELLEGVIRKNIEKIEKRVKLFKKEVPIHLSFHLEKNPHKTQYFCWVNLYLPFKVLRAQSSKNDVESLINEVFSALCKQVEKFKYKLERHLRKKG